MSQEKEQTKLICPFCSKEFGTKMLADFEFTGSGCETCGYDEHTGSIEIFCENCGKLIYKKEGIII